jgi:hypothetical protein
MYKLFLDDVRNPQQVFPTTSTDEWVIVRSYRHFVDTIQKQGLPFMISFDHDLADEHYRDSMYNPDKHYTNYYNDGTFKEKTGYHCAQWLVTYCLDKKIDLPKWNVHSMNPVGKVNIISLLTSYERFQSDNSS